MNDWIDVLLAIMLPFERGNKLVRAEAAYLHVRVVGERHLCLRMFDGVRLMMDNELGILCFNHSATC